MFFHVYRWIKHQLEDVDKLERGNIINHIAQAYINLVRNMNVKLLTLFHNMVMQQSYNNIKHFDLLLQFKITFYVWGLNILIRIVYWCYCVTLDFVIFNTF